MTISLEKWDYVEIGLYILQYLLFSLHLATTVAKKQTIELVLRESDKN